MAEVVYILCAATSLGCALMLLRGYRKLRTPLLFWSSACFVCFALTLAVDSQGLGISAQNITSGANANLALTAVQNAVNNLGTVQGRVGAAMNRLQYAASQAQTMYVSVSASESRIRDADIATESSNLTKFNILTQSGLAALGQANTSAQAVLMLLR